MQISLRRPITGTLTLLFALLATALPAAAQSPGFTFEMVQEQARTLAAAPYSRPSADAVPAALRNLPYDHYHAIRFKPDQALWRQRERSLFRAHFFPAGFVYTEPVTINVVTDGIVGPVQSRTDMFDWSDARLTQPLDDRVPLAGFKVVFPLHRPDVDDEVAVFLGASYFRLLGREQTYGISARGLAIDTGLQKQEEFPVFRAFWLVTPKDGARELTIYALLDSPGVAGAYRFVIRPGTDTTVDVTATLFARHDIQLLGIAPLTSMFLAGENIDRRRDADYRPEVHDSDGLLMHTGHDEWVWRPLNNPTDLAITAFTDNKPRGFGLLQRDRAFGHYQDTQARYHQRPGFWIEPHGDWGEGEVRLIEIPGDAEIHDNIVAFWMPKAPLKGGERRELAYRIRTVADAVSMTPGATVVATRIAKLGLPGAVEANDDRRRAVIDFASGDLDVLRPGQPVTADVRITNGQILRTAVEPLPGPAPRLWRLTIDFDPDGKQAVDLRAFLKLYDQVLGETWSYVWRP